MMIKRMLCALGAAAVMGTWAYPAAAEVQDKYDDVHIIMMAQDDEDDSSKTDLKEKTRSHWQIYACMGAGAIVVISVISLLADKKKTVETKDKKKS